MSFLFERGTNEPIRGHFLPDLDFLFALSPSHPAQPNQLSLRGRVLPHSERGQRSLRHHPSPALDQASVLQHLLQTPRTAHSTLKHYRGPLFLRVGPRAGTATQIQFGAGLPPGTVCSVCRMEYSDYFEVSRPISKNVASERLVERMRESPVNGFMEEQRARVANQSKEQLNSFLKGDRLASLWLTAS